GHTDSRPIAKRSRKIHANNYVLSHERANTIARYISERLNLPPSRITSIGMGADKPIADNDTPEGRKKNRRVELIVITNKTRVADMQSISSSPVKSIKVTGLRPGEKADKKEPLAEESLKQEDAYLVPSLDKRWLNQAQHGQDWVWPVEGYYPSIPSTKIAIKHAAGEKPTLLLAGRKVNALNFQGTRTNRIRDVAISQWSGIDLEMGENNFEVIFYDTDGNESGRLTHTLYVANPPVDVEFVPERSQLVADGKTPPVIAVRLTDQQGHPARQGVVGAFDVAAPYRVLDDRDAAQMLLHENDHRRIQYRVGVDGIALIELEPTTRTGEVVMKFPFENSDEDVRAWLEPDARDWILVGIAEGTAGYGSISGNMQSLGASGIEDEVYADGRVALFAKGRIRGDWLLTMAYDSAKKQREGNERLHQTIDPDEYYTLYGDNTEQGFEAASSKKLYVKLERQQFYAMFGDYSTGLTISELSRYERSLTGVKSELHTDDFGYNVFVSETQNSFAKDEIPGDGTSGLYRLSRGDIVINSEEITIETRDRFHSEEIISSQVLRRHLDYSIDYSDGTLFFKLPVTSRDPDLNPIYIVANYETRQDGEELLTIGGRGYVKPIEGVEIGVTHVSEEQLAGDGRLSGVDATIELGKATQLKAEISHSRDAAGVDADAHIAELKHRSGKLDARIYHRQQDEGFGLGQQRGSENATRKMGFDGSYLLTERVTLNSEVYRQENLA
ncbi:MAG: OmpA family protein, partial [Gammaproteobacteria bacterium]|nr:OmpA family protein [Gammaproteobacteria bacterium]